MGRPKGSLDRGPRKRRSDAQPATHPTSIRLDPESRAWLSSESARLAVGDGRLVRAVVGWMRRHGTPRSVVTALQLSR